MFYQKLEINTQATFSPTFRSKWDIRPIYIVLGKRLLVFPQNLTDPTANYVLDTSSFFLPLIPESHSASWTKRVRRRKFYFFFFFFFSPPVERRLRDDGDRVSRGHNSWTGLAQPNCERLRVWDPNIHTHIRSSQAFLLSQARFW